MFAYIAGINFLFGILILFSTVNRLHMYYPLLREFVDRGDLYILCFWECL